MRARGRPRSTIHPYPSAEILSLSLIRGHCLPRRQPSGTLQAASALCPTPYTNSASPSHFFREQTESRCWSRPGKGLKTGFWVSGEPQNPHHQPFQGPPPGAA